VGHFGKRRVYSEGQWFVVEHTGSGNVNCMEI